MPTNRTRRTRARKQQSFSPAQIEWLSGETQEGACKWEMFRLEGLMGVEGDPRDGITWAEDLLDRARTFLTDEQIADVEKRIQKERKRQPKIEPELNPDD